MQSKKRGFPSSLRILVAVFFGIVTGALLGPKAEVLGGVGLLVVQVLKALATPLVFFAIVDGFHKTDIRPKSGIKLLSLSLINACVAGSIAISISTLFPVGKYFDLSRLGQISSQYEPALLTHKVEFLSVLKEFAPKNVLEPFIQNNIVSVVLVALLVGIASKNLKTEANEYKVLEAFFSGSLKLVMIILNWIMKCVPIAVFAVVAKMVGTSGFDVFKALGMFVLLITAGILVHVGIYYSLLLLLVTKSSPKKFFKDATEVLVTAFGTGSSLATLPVTLKTLQEKMKVSAESSRLAACVGTNLNHDGILLYEAMTALFVAQVYGIDLGLAQKAGVLAISTLAAVGIAGVPDAGLITLSLVLNTLGLPFTLVPIFMTVDWYVGRLRAMGNVSSDLVVAKVLDKLS